MPNVHHLSVYIDRSPGDVYAFAADPRNLPRWAAGLARSEARIEGDHWRMDSPMGSVRVKFAETNTMGVLDHDVTLESGLTVHNPMRVLPRESGSEFVFTLFRQAGMSDQQFSNDRAAVEKDLQTLKRLLEQGQ